MPKQDIAILIPAYKPDGQMVPFIKSLHEYGIGRIIVVDDGGGAPYAHLFDQITEFAEILVHPVNRGKGAALKTGLNHISKTPGTAVITADADGQHSPGDIIKIAAALRETPDALILGARNKQSMPPRSKAGNTMTCFWVNALVGLRLTDTQTGLRGIPASALNPFMALEGDRYEYEMSMLISAAKNSIPIREIEIETIYFDGNKGSHFKAMRDGMRIYGILFKQVIAYILSSLASTAIDYALFFIVLWRFPDNLFAAVFIARASSSLANYFINRNVVFKRKEKTRTLYMYYALVAANALCNYLMQLALAQWGVTAAITKPAVDLVLYAISYRVQSRYIFK